MLSPCCAYRLLMYEWLPEDVRLMRDISPASWVIDRFRPWGVDYPQPVACVMPDVFDAYARVLHPGREYIRDSDGQMTVRWVRWSELAARRGVEVTAATRWEEASGFMPQTGPVDGIDEPYDGSMPESLVEAVATFLHPRTTTPGACWFGMWEGNGTWWKGSHAGPLTRSDLDVVLNTDDPELIARIRAEAERRDQERDDVLRHTPTFGTPRRQFFLMLGPLSAARPLTDAGGGSSPNLWWPEDRAWFVSTEVDGLSTYVGGDASMIDALTASRTIEAFRTSVDDPLAY